MLGGEKDKKQGHAEVGPVNTYRRLPILIDTLFIS
jgi:hypothetical protein